MDHQFSFLHSLTGANPSAEEQEESLEDGAISVNNIVHSFRLQATTFDKKSYLSYLKVRPTNTPYLPWTMTYSTIQGYMKEVKSKLDPDRVATFEKGASAFAKKIVSNFKDFEFVSPSSHCLKRLRPQSLC